MSPQSCKFSGNFLFSLLVSVGSNSDGSSGFGWSLSVAWCLQLLSMMTSLMNGIFRSLWSVSSETYQGASAMLLRIFD
ncbi:unnamed protein product [Acanthoscelides obtectus]|uniref:Uncharacterized protein n=1 Tax=Acanthoscelides obtectus TaxID=200917 RepID=A0A9P0P641_ACAOB|nr:unnamed protein product [Acanthoscelides obtectus]CAK1643689.1 hypothetical protein AOBTE_LOCUS13638 [Acanthoscelides obtectus]